ncbi:MAG: response regulator [Acidimicrobiia bacterium]|nr:response regulator [Acidimicrobiia bacterium]
MQSVLVVDDEEMVRDVLSTYLERDGFNVLTAGTAEEADGVLADSHPDLIVLDVMLPGGSGLDILTAIAGRVPVILLTAKTEESERILGLELGADDYVTKPFSPREIVARVRSVLRRSRSATTQGSRLVAGDIAIDTDTREVFLNGNEVELTAKEFELLAFLVASPRQVFSRDQLLAQVWESSEEWQDPATVTVHIRRLRAKIEQEPSQPERLQTVWGVGYRFQP